MLLLIKRLLAPAAVDAVIASLPRAAFADGRETAGPQARQVKLNRQIASGDPRAEGASRALLQSLRSSQSFWGAALPVRVMPPLFAMYGPGMSYGDHIDNPVLAGKVPVRTDIACTIFLSPADRYEGGELVVRGELGEQAIKGDAGDVLIYPASFVHRVAPVRSGVRLVAVTWVQSMVRDPARRRILHDLSVSLRELRRQAGAETPAVRSLTRTHANLVRMWAEI